MGFGLLRDRAAKAEELKQKIKEYIESLPENQQKELAERAKAQLKEFEDNKNNDITCIAYAIRNIYAHGDLTPTAMKIRSIKRGKIFFDLADFLLEYCDEIFTKVIDKLR
jgi:formyltetrahydrofolate synthetase